MDGHDDLVPERVWSRPGVPERHVVRHRYCRRETTGGDGSRPSSGDNGKEGVSSLRGPLGPGSPRILPVPLGERGSCPWGRVWSKRRRLTDNVDTGDGGP